jgi:diadenosine tetraphosphate (Ap4A) HIT family hydrolase
MMNEKDCIFCKIARGEIAPLGNAMIYEDEKFMAWLSPFPNTLGFSVVIPKKHFPSDVLKMSDNDLKEFVLVAKKVSEILENYFEDVGRVGLIMEGTGIDHAHIKLFPMHGTEYMKKGEWRQISSGKADLFFENYAGYLASNDGPKANFDELARLAKEIKELAERQS